MPCFGRAFLCPEGDNMKTKTLEEQVKVAGQSLIDNATKIAECYKFQTDLDIHIRFPNDDISPMIEVNKEFIPEGVVND
jgi:hypothetical protein